VGSARNPWALIRGPSRRPRKEGERRGSLSGRPAAIMLASIEPVKLKLKHPTAIIAPVLPG